MLSTQQVKCEQYWPDDGETEEYGDITVDTLQSEAYADYTERIFQAEKEVSCTQPI